MFRVNNFCTIQECIPLGCVPAAAVATTRCQYKRGFCPEGGLCPQRSLSRGCLYRRSLSPTPTPGQNNRGLLSVTRLVTTIQTTGSWLVLLFVNSSSKVLDFPHLNLKILWIGKKIQWRKTSIRLEFSSGEVPSYLINDNLCLCHSKRLSMHSKF